MVKKYVETKVEMQIIRFKFNRIYFMLSCKV